ncbi:DDE-type integrase/transposase/recombinase [Vibrio furnissii]|uniref:DDE-type integrase/transposase/recombinase n=1 Tax=Vibrio furnissii TaxID=29494 RepID=UPI003B8339F0
MKNLNLVAKRPKQHRYPSGGVASVIAPNKLNRQFNPEQLNTYWSGDITYIRTQQGWLYLAIIMDLCSRRVISWAFSDKPNSERLLELCDWRNKNEELVVTWFSL